MEYSFIFRVVDNLRAPGGSALACEVITRVLGGGAEVELAAVRGDPAGIADAFAILAEAVQIAVIICCACMSSQAEYRQK